MLLIDRLLSVPGLALSSTHISGRSSDLEPFIARPLALIKRKEGLLVVATMVDCMST